ncbi:MAG: restriction alleviation protein, Lar family [Colwellia sp.]|nr:restriction alleviation protein, Lar family [Colwellia sp.]
MKIPNLKPCPFCEGKASMVRGDHHTGHPRWYKAYCTNCQNRTWEHPRKKNAVAAWNTRAT